MRRREATRFLREIANYAEAMPLNYIFLKSHDQSLELEMQDIDLYIKVYDSSALKLIERLAEQHGYSTKFDTNGYVVIFSHERDLSKILV